jgi:hypothetical protein
MLIPESINQKKIVTVLPVETVVRVRDCLELKVATPIRTRPYPARFPVPQTITSPTGSGKRNMNQKVMSRGVNCPL